MLNKNTRKFTKKVIDNHFANRTSRVRTKTGRRGRPRPWHYSAKTSYTRYKGKPSRTVSLRLKQQNRLGSIKAKISRKNIGHTGTEGLNYTYLDVALSTKPESRLKRKIDNNKLKEPLPGLEPGTGETTRDGLETQPLRYVDTTNRSLDGAVSTKPESRFKRKLKEPLPGLEPGTVETTRDGLETLPLRYVDTTNRSSPRIRILSTTLNKKPKIKMCHEGNDRQWYAKKPGIKTKRNVKADKYCVMHDIRCSNQVNTEKGFDLPRELWEPGGALAS